MRLIAPTNWDESLINEYALLGVNEVYAKLAFDVIGGGRSVLCLQNVSRRKVAAYIGYLHKKNIEFNYLLNASCLASREFTASGSAEIYKLLDWLVSIEVDKVTVSIPYLAQVIKQRYPRLKISVSVNAYVDSLERARFWEGLGASEITLSHLRTNRDFAMLRLIRAKVSCGLRLIANASCLYMCPLSHYHCLFDAHSSQTAFRNKAGFAVDYCQLSCRLIRLKQMREFIRSQWIRPEDISYYEQIGIDGIKLIDRKCSSEELLRIAGAYSKRAYSGNLADLLPSLQPNPSVRINNFFMKLRCFFHPGEVDLRGFIKMRRLMGDMGVYIDNDKLNGFLEHFKQVRCDQQDCDTCGYCGEIASRTVRFDEKRLCELKDGHEGFLKYLISGKMFRR